MEKSVAISELCLALTNGMRQEAITLLRREYPFKRPKASPRKYTLEQATRVFVRDGFIDRYTGKPLVFPPVLRVLSAEMPDDFPYHRNWKMSVTHPAYWQISATLDHVIPVSDEGDDNDSNWVTTSMAKNSEKGNSRLEDLGWTIREKGNFKEWDGLVHWFLEYVKMRPELLATPAIRQGHRAIRNVLG